MVYSIFRWSTYSSNWVFVHSFSSLSYCKKYILKHLVGQQIKVTRHLPFEDPDRSYFYDVTPSVVVPCTEVWL